MTFSIIKIHKWSINAKTYKNIYLYYLVSKYLFWWRLFKKSVVCTIIDIYVSITKLWKTRQNNKTTHNTSGFSKVSIRGVINIDDKKMTIRSCNSTDRQHNGQKKKDKRTNSDVENITQKTKNRATRNHKTKHWANSCAPEGRAVPAPHATGASKGLASKMYITKSTPCSCMV